VVYVPGHWEPNIPTMGMADLPGKGTVLETEMEFVH